MSSISDPTLLHVQEKPVEPEQAAGHDEHEGLAHITPWQTLVKVWAALMVLTILTVMATWIDLGSINIFIALGIAVVKATLVVMYFMHMKYDKPFNCYIFMFAFAFVGFFLGMAMLDSKHYAPMIEKRRIDTDTAKYELPPAPPPPPTTGASEIAAQQTAQVKNPETTPPAKTATPDRPEAVAANKSQEATEAGVWQFVSMIADGKETPADQLKQLELTIDGKNYTVKRNGEVVDQGTYKADRSAKPAALERTSTAGDFKGKTFKGISEEKPDEMRVCWGPPNGDRPSDFESKAGSGRTLEVIKRVKK